MRNKLTEDCLELDKPGYHADGGGLYLNVKADARRYWCFRWRDRFERYSSGKSAGLGKLREKGLGRAGEHDVSLAEARRLAGICRKMVREGRNPINGDEWQEYTGSPLPRPTLTFEDCMELFLEEKKRGWKNPGHAALWRNSLKAHAGSLMQVPVYQVDTERVLYCVKPIWTTKTETATRLRQRIEKILEWATEHRHRRGDNPARWRGHLDRMLPRPTRLKRVKSRSSLHYTDLAQFMSRLRSNHSLAARALELQILTARRPAEVVSARWDEFGLKGAIWNLPGVSDNPENGYTVPLAPPAVELLKALPRVSEFVFPGRDPRKAMTTAAGMKLLKSLQPGLTQQGFRTTFRNWAECESGYPSEVTALALASSADNKVQDASLRSDLIARRARLMRDWAVFCG